MLHPLFKKVAKERAAKEGLDAQRIIDYATAFYMADVTPARVYAFCKTGVYYTARATQAYFDAIEEYETIQKNGI